MLIKLLLICVTLVGVLGAQQATEDSETETDFINESCSDISPRLTLPSIFEYEHMELLDQLAAEPKSLGQDGAAHQEFVDAYNVIKLDIVNSTHLAITKISTSKFCNNTNRLKLKMYFKTINNDTLKLSALEVEWTNNQSSPVLIEHDTSNVILLHDMTGWTTVLYDATLFQRIINQLEENPSVFPMIPKLFFLDGVFTQIAADPLSILKVTRFMDLERDPFIWSQINLILNKFLPLLDFHPGRVMFKSYIARKVNSLFGSIGTNEQNLSLDETEIENRAILRAYGLQWDCITGGNLCTEKAKNFYVKWKSDPTEELVRATSPYVISRLMEIGGYEAYNMAFEVYEKFSLPNVVYSLAESSRTLNVKIFVSQVQNISSANDANGIEMAEILKAFAKNPATRYDFIYLLAAHVDNIIATHGAISVVDILKDYAAFSHHKFEKMIVEGFLKNKATKLATVQDDLISVVDRLNKNIEWIDSHESTICSWLGKQLDLRDNNSQI